MNILTYETVSLDENQSALLILDQTKLPGHVKILRLTDIRDIWNAIKTLQVRGAPAIGIAAAFGLYLSARNITASNYPAFMAGLKDAKDYLNSARPTAVNLSWALNRVYSVAEASADKAIPEIIEALRLEALAIKSEDTETCRKIGEYGLTLIHDGDGILTHCNAGQLATSKYGTALAPIHLGREKGMNFRVYCDETRPLLQGARLSAFELVADGVDTTLICDNMASQVMKEGRVSAVFVGCDRLAANGDCCNKIGTSGLAIMAKYYGVPFYVFCPASTIDMTIQTGAEIVIEQRNPDEVTEMWYSKRMAPDGVKVYNPAFDVTDNSLIAGIVTEYGIARPPYIDSLREILTTGATASNPSP
ncbi:MAG: S-methyl-5-thioribose-1-phosphate isomerase [Synergistaceae bacterium]|nr:S-methyl-5-thioribose-1-phosphate isomerase [Synergistaceae bacterium]